jgi:enoyl-CoA hydratase/carnithine racemase
MQRTRSSRDAMAKEEPTMSSTSSTQPAYFSKYASVRFERDNEGVLTMSLHSKGGPLTFTAAEHEAFVDAFYDVSRDRANKVVILTGAGGDFMPAIDFPSFGDVSDPDVWSKVHDEGTQIVENIANIRVPMIWALEGKAHVHAEYGLLANVIIAGESATINDLPHFAGGIIPGDGVFTLWNYFVGPGRAQAMLLDPKPLGSREAQALGVVAEVVPDGKAHARAREIAKLFLTKPEVTRRNTRIHFIQPIKERLVREVGYGLALEGASAAALVKSFRTM